VAIGEHLQPATGFFKDVKEIFMAGPVPTAPLNRFAMLTDYITPDQRLVACPNQDVIYGAGSLALDVTPVIIQVPDFGDRFWVYQVVDLRTDCVVQLGKMYGTTPGFYMLVGPSRQGEVPKGTTKLFPSPTNTGFVAPRIFQDDTPEDKQAIQNVLQQIMMYPLAEYDGKMKRFDWRQVKKLPSATASGETETRLIGRVNQDVGLGDCGAREVISAESCLVPARASTALIATP
jgi:hypothetical protein